MMAEEVFNNVDQNGKRESVAKTARRQHFIARFYLRNFAEPIFSDNLCVYDMQKKLWDTCTPKGVGWFPHLHSVIDLNGKRRDDFSLL